MTLESLRLRYVILQRKGYIGISVKDVFNLYSYLVGSDEGIANINFYNNYGSRIPIDDKGSSMSSVCGTDMGMAINYIKDGTINNKMLLVQTPKSRGIIENERVVDLVQRGKDSKSYVPLIFIGCLVGMVNTKYAICQLGINSVLKESLFNISLQDNGSNPTYTRAIARRKAHLLSLEFSLCCDGLGDGDYLGYECIKLIKEEVKNSMVVGKNSKYDSSADIKMYKKLLVILHANKNKIVNLNCFVIDETSIEKYSEEMLLVLPMLYSVCPDSIGTSYEKLVLLCDTTLLKVMFTKTNLLYIANRNAIMHEIA